MIEEFLYEHRVRIYRKPTKWHFSRDIAEISEIAILAHNDKYVVLNDASFTKLEKKGDGVCWPVINKPIIYFKDVLGEKGIFYTLYSPSKKRIPTIEGQIRNKAEAEYGWLFSKELDFSALKEMR
jgi:hypothetical protein